MEIFVHPEGNDAWSGTSPSLQDLNGPFRSPVRAQLAVRELKAKNKGLTESVTVWFAPGSYPLTTSWLFTPDDSGTRNCPVIYAARQDAGSARITGGRRITDWTRRSDGLWTAIPDRLAINRGFQQLFLNGRRITRARIPHDGYFEMVDFTAFNDPRSFKYRPGDIRKFRNFQDVQVLILRSWDDARLFIKRLDETNGIVCFTGPTMPDHADGSFHGRRDEGPHAKYFLDNVFEGLDAPGRWYFDKSYDMLYLRPDDGLDPNDAEIVVPLCQQLLDVTGWEGCPVEHIEFQGLTFEHADWSIEPGGYSGIQSDLVPAAIRFEHAAHCAFRGNAVARVGGYALSLGEGCQWNEILENEIYDAGSGGIKSGEVPTPDAVIPAANGKLPDYPPAKHNNCNTFSRNHIHHCGVVYPGAVGIWIGQSSDNVISHNTLHDLTYTGISVGYMWANVETRCKRNRIERNEIFRVMQLMNDGAGIYMLGRSHGTVVQHNVIYGCRPAFTNNARGIYLDESISGVTVRNNVTYDTGDGAMLLHICWDNIIENNLFLESFVSQMYFCFEKGPSIGQRNVIRRNVFAFSRPESLLYQTYMTPDPANCRIEDNLVQCPEGRTLIKINLDEKGEWMKEAIIEDVRRHGLDTTSAFVSGGVIDPRNLCLLDAAALEKVGFVPFEIELSGLIQYIREKK